MLLQYPASNKDSFFVVEKINVLQKNQITVIIAMKKQQGQVQFSDGCDGRAPALEMCSLHPSSTKIAKRHRGRDPGQSTKLLRKSRRENSRDAALD